MSCGFCCIVARRIEHVPFLETVLCKRNKDVWPVQHKEGSYDHNDSCVSNIFMLCLMIFRDQDAFVSGQGARIML